jgi:hypothetical protein
MAEESFEMIEYGDNNGPKEQAGEQDADDPACGERSHCGHYEAGKPGQNSGEDLVNGFHYSDLYVYDRRWLDFSPGR